MSLDAAGSSPETVLCIDDEDNQLLLRKLLLEEAGYRVFTATSGEEGIRVFQAEQVDVVIVDYWMSRMNGLVVARALKTLRSINQRRRIVQTNEFQFTATICGRNSRCGRRQHT